MPTFLPGDSPLISGRESLPIPKNGIKVSAIDGRLTDTLLTASFKTSAENCGQRKTSLMSNHIFDLDEVVLRSVLSFLLFIYNLLIINKAEPEGFDPKCPLICKDL
jgi:hypothetical protein